MPASAEPAIEITTHFVRTRHALVARAGLSPLFVDYYLHLAAHGLRPAAEHDVLFKAALAAFALHCAVRPRHETLAWTLHFEDPRLNVFLAGDTGDGTVAGRVFAEDVREMGANHFYADVARPGRPVRRSAVTFAGADPFAAAEAFYRQSEQRPARYFALDTEEFALVEAHPDCDVAWFDALEAGDVRALADRETLVPMERRSLAWSCGCHERKILQVLAQAARADPDGLFAGEETLRVHCPRCGARYAVTREALEAFLASPGG